MKTYIENIVAIEQPKCIIEWQLFGNKDITISLTKKPTWLARKTISFFLGSKWRNIK